MLTFTFTVRAGDNTMMLEYDGDFAFILPSGAAIQNGNGLANLKPPPTTGSISDSLDPLVVDGIAPTVPSFTDPAAIAGDDNIINAAEQAAGVDLTGNIDFDASIRLCIGGTLANLNAAIPSCSGGTIGDASKDTTTTWIYALSTEFITTNLTEGGTSTLILIATDAAGNHAASESVTISPGHHRPDRPDS